MATFSLSEYANLGASDKLRYLANLADNGDWRIPNIDLSSTIGGPEGKQLECVFVMRPQARHVPEPKPYVPGSFDKCEYPNCNCPQNDASEAPLCRVALRRVLTLPPDHPLDKPALPVGASPARELIFDVKSIPNNK